MVSLICGFFDLQVSLSAEHIVIAVGGRPNYPTNVGVVRLGVLHVPSEYEFSYIHLKQ